MQSIKGPAKTADKTKKMEYKGRKGCMHKVEKMETVRRFQNEVVVC